MTAIKSTLFCSFLLLAACAPRPGMEVPSNFSGSNAANPVPGTTDTGKTETTAQTTNKTTGIAATPSTSTTAEATKSAATASAAAISSWEISGAMAARSKNKGWNASVNWMQRGLGQYQIRLFGPLGSGTVIINKQGGVVTYRDGPKSASSSNADELLKKETGIRLPVNNLYYWVRGLPAPGNIQSAKRDSANHLLVLRQGGYTIEYGQYKTIGNVALPSLIRLQGNGVFIKFVIKRWKI
ncbi:outer membrane lipoprotein LolB [Legionella lansingensis]|uniref:Outer-membrane lipoprotein LolB n=1 Tax=Legionella lansingensis TaxID=45067 RepID=A0A0W0VQ88_9GAMM|nr:lipoprotein insertase outer membrane protein LolB [Legionella lansingensis]KTD22211.1 outer membrane lipoprotein LolB [Legionella lansingensis]SNV55051.1 outer membrane lipoprotein LolB [Legionella lansingensis]